MKDDLCEFCGHRRDHHHQGCDICQAIPSRHGHYCEEPLCCCVDFLGPEEASDEDIIALMEQA